MGTNQATECRQLLEVGKGKDMKSLAPLEGMNPCQPIAASDIEVKTTKFESHFCPFASETFYKHKLLQIPKIQKAK